MGRKTQSSNSSSGLKFRPGMEKIDSKGVKPLPEPTSICNVILLMLLHVCRKIMFINTFYRVIYYLCLIFLFSIVVDFVPAPRGPAARKENFFNQYFVKIGWGWTLLILLPFVCATSYVYCCGKRKKILLHTMRLVIATGFWLFWTKTFVYIENIYGRCNVRDEKFAIKSSCLERGYFWQGMDISGHCFLLIYSTLIIIEEARVIYCWEGISDYIRDEEFARTSDDSTSYRVNPLKTLNDEEFQIVRIDFPKLTPWVRGLFISLTVLTVIWEAMLLITVLYYHNMLEKFLAGLLAVFTWYLTYYMWYASGTLPPCLPGEGSFRYKDLKQRETITKRRQTVPKSNQGPTFMGMPIRKPQEEKPTDTNHT